MKRTFLKTLGAIVLAATTLACVSTMAAEPKIGIVMLHGKNPGSNRDPNFRLLVNVFEREDWVVAFPNMPWASMRYLDGNWDQAMAEIAEQVTKLRSKGATKIVLVGHSIGSPASLSFAARGGDVQALVLVAPGHNPIAFYTLPRMKAVHDSVDEARALVASGKGAEKSRFSDFNQGKDLSVSMTASDYLSYLDPNSDAEMSLTAARVPAQVPVMAVIGDADPLFKALRSSVYDKLPTNPKNQYLEVQANHLTTPEVASAEIVTWIKTAVAD